MTAVSIVDDIFFNNSEIDIVGMVIVKGYVFFDDSQLVFQLRSVFLAQMRTLENEIKLTFNGIARIFVALYNAIQVGVHEIINDGIA